MPELMKRVKELLRQKDETIEVPQMMHGKDRMQGEFATEIGRFLICYIYSPRYKIWIQNISVFTLTNVN
jgi:hypothetical protein